MKLSWQTITVQQFQDVYRLSLSPSTGTGLDEIEKLERIIAILFNKSEKEVEEMTMTEFTACAKECAFIMQMEKIPGKRVKYIRCGKRKYAVQYNPAKLRHRQYVEILHFGDKPIENMHLIMASLVQPVSFGFWKRKNEAYMHQSIAEDMLNAPLINVYHATVFFCKLYVNLITAIKDYLVAEMTKDQKMEKKEAEALVDISRNAMAGFIQPAKWQHLNA